MRKWYKTIDESGNVRWDIWNDSEEEKWRGTHHKVYATIDKLNDGEGPYMARCWDEEHEFSGDIGDDFGYNVEGAFDTLKEAQSWLERKIEACNFNYCAKK
jgi:hypothetical protein